ncbi:MAG: hypothetical protein BMS9Abin26_2019 [Gammaproteobacteria bacterium]|nr:MAG: hypothetical protein BMS9Abin26_2019 [Gammaproteobacteria bacterium]
MINNKLTKFLGVIALTLMLNLAQADGAGAGPGYKLAPEDVLEISVWKEEGLQREVLVRPDGILSFPLVGSLQAAGHTPEEVRAQLIEKLKKYIPDPVVTVSVKSVAGNKIYVLGKVNRPGVYNVGHYVDVMQALALAGGLTPFAAANSINILRRTDGEQQSFGFKYGEVEDGKDLQQNIILKSGDVVVVP